MTLEIILSIIAIAITVIFYFADKIINGSTRSAKKYLLSKWLDNKSKNLKLQETIYQFVSSINGWDAKAFTDSNHTYLDFYTQLKQTYEVEYSDVQLNGLKKAKLSKFQIDEYIGKLKVQEDNLNLIQVSLESQVKKYYSDLV